MRNLFVCCLLSLLLASGAVLAQTKTIVPLGGNAFVTRPAPAHEELIDDTGLHNWTSNEAIVSVYFFAKQAGTVELSLVGALHGANRSTVEVSIDGQRKQAVLAGTAASSIPVGTFTIARPGYVKVDLQGVSTDGGYFGDVSGLEVGGSAAAAGLAFADDPANFYWSRRGPSGHLNFTVPEHTEYFYSEITVPKGHDRIGSYFMANGFSTGYFGIQVNSETERRVLFSVWDSPGGKTTLVKKGDGVSAQDFGGEGTGGQSFLRYDWKPGSSYRFITRARPDGRGNTLYSAWFGAPCLPGADDCEWKFLATWRYEGVSSYLTKAHSFIESFYPELGHLERMAHYGNQWAISKDGVWTELKSARFSVDATARNRQRLDVTAGATADSFYMRNGGFFDKAAAPGTHFTRSSAQAKPRVDLDALPEPR
ncbi:uncharacterized protein DUF3472 [Luteimonas cucumeris]|uniref:Uncharacterized protein DUF3472 n=1 Tax=Luteimonas cucumeris TaxID=985012 RepID=A0A562L2J7_9GAMM|nr:DUF5077 domain-containing protein [Luteimonas cucumeris]TWI01855.1 uncharacterized protein DUF3472 [Luteimonas cucumeris]